MLDKEFVKKLKQVNVSVDTAKASERLKAAYGALSRADKERLITMTGQNRHSLYRAERTGLITAKLLLPAAFICNLSPEWLSGESDEAGAFGEAGLLSFLQKHGYHALAAELESKKTEKKQRKRGRKSAKELAEAAEAAAAIAAEASVTGAVEECAEEEEDSFCVSLQFQTNEAHQKTMDALDTEQAVYLLRALAIRSAYNEEDAQIYDVVKRCLLT